MFLISKLVWLVAQPLSVAFILCAFGALAGLFGWRRLGSVFALLASLVLFVTLYTTAGSVALQVLEARFQKPGEPADLSCMIVLGGALENEVTSSRGGVELNQAADRYVEALRLALKYPQSRILVSGGDGSFSGAYEGEAEASQRLFGNFGVSSDRLVKENASRTTYENTQQTSGLLASQGLQDCLLITSAFHMPRSVGLFRKAGITITPWPVDYRTSGRVAPGFDFTQPALNAQLTGTAVREWLGLAGYYASGRIDALLPD